MRIKRQLRLLNKIDNKYKLSNYKNEEGQIDFYNFYNDQYVALCNTFGKKPLKNECPEVAEARRALMVGAYQERKDKSVIDLKMECLSRELFAEYKKDNDECLEMLINAFYGYNNKKQD